MTNETENTEAEAPAKEPKITVSSIATAAIKAGKDNAEALAEVKAQLPDAKTTLSSINWYRNKLRNDNAKGDDGNSIPTARELKKSRADAGATNGTTEATEDAGGDELD